MLCQFEIAEGIATCTRCSRPTPTRMSDPARIRRSCPAKPEPGPAAKVRKFSKAVARWIAAGMPTRSPERIAELFAICQACDHFKPKRIGGGSCMLCGCEVKRKGLQNKLRMATETCPMKVPKWEAEA